MNTDQALSKIEEKIVTLQQEKGFNAFKESVDGWFECDEINDETFMEFYCCWCVENGLFNDINQSNF